MLDRYSIQELSQTILQFWLLQVVTTFTMFRFPELDRSRVWIRSLAAILFGLQIETKEVSAKICEVDREPGSCNSFNQVPFHFARI